MMGTQLLFFDTFSHEAVEELNLDLVQFPSPVVVEEVRSFQKLHALAKHVNIQFSLLHLDLVIKGFAKIVQPSEHFFSSTSALKP